MSYNMFLSVYMLIEELFFNFVSLVSEIMTVLLQCETSQKDSTFMDYSSEILLPIS